MFAGTSARYGTYTACSSKTIPTCTSRRHLKTKILLTHIPGAASLLITASKATRCAKTSRSPGTPKSATRRNTSASCTSPCSLRRLSGTLSRRVRGRWLATASLLLGLRGSSTHPPCHRQPRSKRSRTALLHVEIHVDFLELVNVLVFFRGCKASCICYERLELPFPLGELHDITL